MDIDSLLNSLTDDDIEKLKATAAQFMGGATGTNEQKASVQPDNNLFGDISPNILTSVAKIAGGMNKSDARCDFIQALKPLLSPERGKKADEAVMMLKFMRILENLKGNMP